MKHKEKILKLNAAGSATNSGIDYQQRVGALFIIYQYTNSQINSYLGLEKELHIDTIHFETADSIDDLKIICDDNIKLYCQIKRCVPSLTESKNSDFYKTFKQFVSEFVTNYSSQNKYFLITTSDSTPKLKKELKKILTSVRLNDTSFNQNPLNDFEKNTLKKYRDIFFQLHKELTGKTTDENDFIKFSKQVYISIIDLEESNSNVHAALMLLKSVNFSNPELIWKLLIANCLTFASKRQSVNKSFIKQLLSQYISVNTKQNIDTEIIREGKISCGKDIILVESFIDEADLLIIELFRFDDFGLPKLRYIDNKLIIQSKDENAEWNVIYRCSSVKGLEKFLDENMLLHENKKIVYLAADKSIDFVEELPYVIAYREKLESELQQSLNKRYCLHCGKSIGFENALLVEVDEIGYRHTIGPIHKECHRNLDRVLGTTGFQNPLPKINLKNFDFQKWISLIIRGQGQITAIKNTSFGELIPIISYNAEREINDGDYCIRMTLEDKTFTYLYCGHEIERYFKDRGEKIIIHLKNELLSAEKDKDPVYATNINYNKGRYTDLIKRKKSNEKLLKVLNYELIKYSAQLSKLNDTIDFDYAPICLVYDSNTSNIISFENLVPLISDPLKFDNYYENWTKAGFIIGDCELKIIESDKDFGIHLMSFFDKLLIPIIDPEFDLNKNIINGFRIINFHTAIKQKIANNEGEEPLYPIKNPVFFKGEKVRVVIPELNQDDYPIGCLFSDELENINGEKYVLFQPIENEKLSDFMCPIPSKLIQKI